MHSQISHTWYFLKALEQYAFFIFYYVDLVWTGIFELMSNLLLGQINKLNNDIPNQAMFHLKHFLHFLRPESFS